MVLVKSIKLATYHSQHLPCSNESNAADTRETAKQ